MASSMSVLSNVIQNGVLKIADEDTTNVAHTQSPTKKVTAKALGTTPTPTSTGAPGAHPKSQLPLGAAMTKDQVAQMDANDAMRGAAYQQGLSAGQPASSGIPTWVWVAGAAAVLYYMSSQ